MDARRHRIARKFGFEFDGGSMPVRDEVEGFRADEGLIRHLGLDHARDPVIAYVAVNRRDQIPGAASAPGRAPESRPRSVRSDWFGTRPSTTTRRRRLVPRRRERRPRSATPYRDESSSRRLPDARPSRARSSAGRFATTTLSKAADQRAYISSIPKLFYVVRLEI